MITIPQRHRQRDGQTSRGNTTLCETSRGKNESPRCYFPAAYSEMSYDSRRAATAAAAAAAGLAAAAAHDGSSPSGQRRLSVSNNVREIRRENRFCFGIAVGGSRDRRVNQERSTVESTSTVSCLGGTRCRHTDTTRATVVFDFLPRNAL